MRFLIQCVDEASVQVDENVTGAIENGQKNVRASCI